MDGPSVKDPHIIMSKTDISDIHSMACANYVKFNQKELKLDDSQYRTYCYIMAVQAWLRGKELLKIILD